MSAYSAAEGRELMRKHRDVAVVLLDVIMETDTAGLELVEFIRKDLKNETVRIILRTGQPGQAPERRVIVDYDINDYKAKTELTADKLFTALTAALRSHQQLQRMVETRRGLEIIIEAASPCSTSSRCNGWRKACSPRSRRCSTSTAPASWSCAKRRTRTRPSRCSQAPAATAASSAPTSPTSSSRTCGSWSRRRSRGAHEFSSRRSVLYIKTLSGREVVVVLEAPRHLSDTDRALVEIFCSRLSIAFDNVILYEQLQRANTRLEERVAARTQDLTNANRRLTAQWARLRQANSFKSEILGTVAHDLKNPLGVILGRTEILKEMIAGAGALDRTSTRRSPISAMPPTGSPRWSTISSRTRWPTRSTSPSGASRSTSRSWCRRSRSEPAARHAQGAVDYRRRAARSRRHVRFRPHPRAIDNLVSNAIKYSPIGGAIDLLVAREGDGILVQVRDQGAGLSPEDISRLFGRFQRLSAKPTAGETSTGLGLSIVKRIVDLHGGRSRSKALVPGRRDLQDDVAGDMTQAQHIVVVDDEQPRARWSATICACTAST